MIKDGGEAAEGQDFMYDDWNVREKNILLTVTVRGGLRFSEFRNVRQPCD